MRPKICFLSRNTSNYSAALYQNDFYNALKKVADVTLVSTKDKLSEVLQGNRPDIFFFGHQWLDEGGNPLFHISAQDLWNSKTVFFINKEYANLNAKIEYVSKLNPDVLLSHHHDLQSLLDRKLDIPILWIPFAANPELFRPAIYSKKYDLNFSGVLRNPSYPSSQADDREVIHHELFHTLGKLSFAKKSQFSKYRIFWKPITGGRFTDLWNRYSRGHFDNSKDSYAARLSLSKATLNTLSPLGLVGTRFFESAMAKSVILAPKDVDLQGLFDESQILRFDVSKSGLLESLKFVSGDSEELNKILEGAYDHALENHTWDQRVRTVVNWLGYNSKQI